MKLTFSRNTVLIVVACSKYALQIIYDPHLHSIDAYVSELIPGVRLLQIHAHLTELSFWIACIVPASGFSWTCPMCNALSISSYIKIIGNVTGVRLRENNTLVHNYAEFWLTCVRRPNSRNPIKSNCRWIIKIVLLKQTVFVSHSPTVWIARQGW